jgi:hypothetical protein
MHGNHQPDGIKVMDSLFRDEGISAREMSRLTSGIAMML